MRTLKQRFIKLKKKSAALKRKYKVCSKKFHKKHNPTFSDSVGRRISVGGKRGYRSGSPVY